MTFSLPHSPPCSPAYWQLACGELRARDEVLAAIIDRYAEIVLESRGAPFVTLLRAIVGQQISVAAANSVWNKVATLCIEVTPHNILTAGHEPLLQCGLSKRKAEYAVGIAQYFQQQSRSIDEWQECTDAAIITELTALRGVGRWTAEMFLIFALLRPNVLPLQDLGLLRAIQLAYRPHAGTGLSEAMLRKITKPWQPWSTVATFYLWRSIDPSLVTY